VFIHEKEVYVILCDPFIDNGNSGSVIVGMCGGRFESTSAGMIVQVNSAVRFDDWYGCIFA